MSTKIKAGTATSGAVVDADATGILELQSGSTPTTAITVDASQNVGIGTTSPVDKLTVVASGSALSQIDSFETAQLRGSSVSYLRVSGGSVDTLLGSEAGGGSAFIGSYSNHPVTFRTNNTERMRIDSNGRIQVNGTTIVDVGRISVTFDGANSTGVSVKATNGGTISAYWNNSNTSVGSITTNGSNVAYNTSSDYRLKENIAPIVGALDKVSALKPVTYTWKESGINSEGFVAHELQEIVPQAVTGKKDAVNEDGSIKAQGIDTSFLVATLTAAIQELNAKVTALETQLGAK